MKHLTISISSLPTQQGHDSNKFYTVVVEGVIQWTRREHRFNHFPLLCVEACETKRVSIFVKCTRYARIVRPAPVRTIPRPAGGRGRYKLRIPILIYLVSVDGVWIRIQSDGVISHHLCQLRSKKRQFSKTSLIVDHAGLSRQT